MTIEELNDLIARGAAQPGIHEVEEMMRLCRALDDQARDLASVCSPGSFSAVATGTETKQPTGPYANLG